jgi:hypothetical protein
MSYFNKFTPAFDASNMSVFGTLETCELTPVSQGEFVYGLNIHVWNPAVVSGAGASVTTPNSLLKLQSGSTNNGFAYITTRRILPYQAAQGNVVRITPLYTVIGTVGTGLSGVAPGTLQLFGVGTIIANVPYDGFFFGMNGNAFGIAYYNRGVLTWIPSSSFNGDNLTGLNGSAFDYVPSNGSPCMVKYPYLGFGNATFFILSPTTAKWVQIHTIQYANAHTQTEISNPQMPILGYVKNPPSGAANVAMGCGSYGAFISGIQKFVKGPSWSAENVKSGITTTETCILNLKNCNSYNGMPNFGTMHLRKVAYAYNGSSIATFRLRIGAIIGGVLVYNPINGSTVDNGLTLTIANSIVSFDIAGTTISGGRKVSSTVIASGHIEVDLTVFEFALSPGEFLSITGQQGATGSALFGASMNWSEDV